MLYCQEQAVSLSFFLSPGLGLPPLPRASLSLSVSALLIRCLSFCLLKIQASIGTAKEPGTYPMVCSCLVPRATATPETFQHLRALLQTQSSKRATLGGGEAPPSGPSSCTAGAPALAVHEAQEDAAIHAPPETSDRLC